MNLSKSIFRLIIACERRNPYKPDKYQPKVKSIYSRIGVESQTYGTVEHIYDRIWVDPGEIKFVTGREWKPWSNKLSHFGSVRDGDWDLREIPNIPDQHKPYPKEFEKQILYQSSKEHFLNGIPWGQTPLYERHIQILKSEDDATIETESDIDQSLKRYDDLFNRISKIGYKSRLELSNPSESYMDTLLDEVLVDIGRDGQLLFVDGRHRLTIAKLLGINKIPVVILVRHKQYVE